MRAMILAAGRGSRLRPLTDTIPKPLIEVAGVPMITFALQLLHTAGITDVVINLHHLGAQIRERLGDGRDYGVRITYSEENPILDTGGAIAAARSYLDSDTFVVLNADTFIELALSDVIAFHRQRHATATLVLRPDPAAERRDDIGVDTTQRVQRFLGCPYDGMTRNSGAGSSDETPRPALRRCMYAGIMVCEPRLFTYLTPGAYSITRETFPQALAASEPIYGYVHDGYWRVLDTPSDLAAGRREIAARWEASSS